MANNRANYFGRRAKKQRRLPTFKPVEIGITVGGAGGSKAKKISVAKKAVKGKGGRTTIAKAYGKSPGRKTTIAKASRAKSKPTKVQIAKRRRAAQRAKSQR